MRWASTSIALAALTLACGPERYTPGPRRA